MMDSDDECTDEEAMTDFDDDATEVAGPVCGTLVYNKPSLRKRDRKRVKYYDRCMWCLRVFEEYDDRGDKVDVMQFVKEREDYSSQAEFDDYTNTEHGSWQWTTG